MEDKINDFIENVLGFIVIGAIVVYVICVGVMFITGNSTEAWGAIIGFFFRSCEGAYGC